MCKQKNVVNRTANKYFVIDGLKTTTRLEIKSGLNFLFVLIKASQIIDYLRLFRVSG